ncbi:Cytochrome P450 [Musa troglodytarum]|uniref:Cytochrome P450 n=1 Tax=Musa troglodytarum TaxID=320322 RepID=A0A9E7F0J1_9LILI|nr:Cytochrome P450 [Musa troglodytarum]
MALDIVLVAGILLSVFVHLLLRRRLQSIRRIPLLLVQRASQSSARCRKSVPCPTPSNLAARYGTTGVVVACSAGAAPSFLKARDLQFANRPSPISGKDVTYDGQDFVFANYGPRWKLLRKLTNLHFLGSKALTMWELVRRDKIGRMLRAMLESSQNSRPVMVSEAMVCASANIIGQVMLSRRVFESQGEESKQFKDAITELLAWSGKFSIGDFVPAIAWMDLQGLQRQLRRVHVKLDALITALVAEHEATAHEREGRPDVLDLVMAKRVDADGVPLSDVNIKGFISVSSLSSLLPHSVATDSQLATSANSIDLHLQNVHHACLIPHQYLSNFFSRQDMFIAGTDTSSIIIEWALAEMLRNPTILQRAQDAMDQVIGKNRRLAESDIPSLPYLRAICKEALRLHPSTSLSLPHYTFEACEVDGYHIPPNTRLVVNVWAIGRDPNVWEHPLEFKPEKFLSGRTAKIEPLGNDFELIPFGAGRRICAGMYAGLIMLQYGIGSLLHSFHWKFADDDEELDMKEKFGAALPKAVPLKAVVSPRLLESAYM